MNIQVSQIWNNNNANSEQCGACGFRARLDVTETRKTVFAATGCDLGERKYVHIHMYRMYLYCYNDSVLLHTAIGPHHRSPLLRRKHFDTYI